MNTESKHQTILNECYADKTKVPMRKDIINRLVAEAGLTTGQAVTCIKMYQVRNGLADKNILD